MTAYQELTTKVVENLNKVKNTDFDRQDISDMLEMEKEIATVRD